MSIPKTGFERAFFVDMITNGIPIKPPEDPDDLVQKIVEEISVAGDYDGYNEGAKAVFLSSLGDPIIVLVVQNDRVNFVLPDGEVNTDHASSIAVILYCTVTILSGRELLNFGPRKIGIPNGKEESFEFDDSLGID